MNIPPQLQGPVALFGRLLLAAVWFPSGLSKIGGFAGTVQFAQSAGMPAPAFMVVCATVIELIAPVLLLIGYQTRWACLALIAFMVLATYYFHNPWAAPQAEFTNQMIAFLKNNAITGALVLILVTGPGPWSLDARKQPAV